MFYLHRNLFDSRTFIELEQLTVCYPPNSYRLYTHEWGSDWEYYLVNRLRSTQFLPSIYPWVRLRLRVLPRQSFAIDSIPTVLCTFEWGSDWEFYLVNRLRSTQFLPSYVPLSEARIESITSSIVRDAPNSYRLYTHLTDKVQLFQGSFLISIRNLKNSWFIINES